jgi:two-component system sensor histidine kinase UhpB
LALAAESRLTGRIVDVRFDDLPALDAQAELLLYRAAQEGLTNVRKHSAAARSTLDLRRVASGHVTLLIHDPGPAIAGTGTGTGGTGLAGLQERAELLGSSVKVERENGFTLVVTVPENYP